jgi:hypothetical protein
MYLSQVINRNAKPTSRSTNPTATVSTATAAMATAAMTTRVSPYYTEIQVSKDIYEEWEHIKENLTR